MKKTNEIPLTKNQKHEQTARDLAMAVDAGRDSLGRKCAVNLRTMRPAGRHTPGIGYDTYIFDIVSPCWCRVAYVTVDMIRMVATISDCC